jgi:hypothetical protein
VHLGWFKFGGVEFFKINLVNKLGVEKSWEMKTPIYLLSAACAEFIADIFLCPLEASMPNSANGLPLAACSSRFGFAPRSSSSHGLCCERTISHRQVCVSGATLTLMGV